MAHAPQSSPELRTQSHVEMATQEDPLSGLASAFLLEGPQVAETLRALVVEGDDETTAPRAEGACLFDLSPAEWRFVRNAPLVGFLMVAGADGKVMPWELAGLARALKRGKHATCELFQAVCRELYRQRGTLLQTFAADTFERAQLSEAYRLVSDKLGPDEAERFKECLMKLGREVAKASGSWLAACGWVRGVERRALAELSQAFGTDR
ncbi:MAG TPA: hypothetical protein VNA24_34615 [Hyalangium sp.]|nr:hypothetical protein [Hyalangium sp.]